MAKQGEIDYLKKLSPAEVRHAALLPFSDANCFVYLSEIAAVMMLLPPPPARLLDLGCGTGWTSLFLARRGYDVVGVDIAADMIEQAERARDEQQVPGVRFVVSDYEGMAFEDEFDCAVFFESLHHAMDEEAALHSACQALRPGGVCVTAEPGQGHAQSAGARQAMDRFGVTEKDMPPAHVIRLARRVGFREATVYPHAYDLAMAVYQGRRAAPGWVRALWRVKRLVQYSLRTGPRGGLVQLVK